MKIDKRTKGVTLIELVIVILVLSIASLGLLSLFNQVIRSTVKQESMTVATQLARGLMEKLMLVDFYELRKPFSDGGYDDRFCDLTTCSDSDWTTDWKSRGYCYNIEVKSINPDYINAPTNNDLADSAAVVDFSNFLRVRVRVWRQGATGARLCPDIDLYTIVTPYKY
ncbi:MAG: type II secretion system protein [Candidatus Omnitrophota bacterium]